MVAAKTTRFEDWEARQMQDAAFRAEVEKLENAYQEDRQKILKRLAKQRPARERKEKQW